VRRRTLTRLWLLAAALHAAAATVPSRAQKENGPPAPEKAPPPGEDPNGALVLIRGDLLRLPPERRKQTRYLDLYPLPAGEREAATAIFGGHVNALSREPEIVKPALVGGRLLRVELGDYGWPAEIWEQLADVDPYYHVKTEAVVGYTNWPGGVWPGDGKYYPPNSFRTRDKKISSAPAPWTDAGLAAGIEQLTGSRAPVVRAQWFLWQTAVQEGRKPGYYDFLGIKDRATFEALIRFDAKLAAKLEQRRVVIFSGITQEPRRLERTATVLGGLWRTFDSAAAVAKHNPLRLLDDSFEFDVSEQFAPLPNGMTGWLLTDSKGVRVDKAPDSIVQGDFTGGRDKRLHVGISCVRCHYLEAGENGIKDIDAAPLQRIDSPDLDKLRELRRQYARDLAPQIEQDRRGYAAAVKQATGLEARRWASAYGRMYAAHDEARIDLAAAAADIGADPQALRKALGGKVGLDSVLSVLAGGGRLPVRQHEEALPSLWLTYKGDGR
jgi:hypothetical protein